MQLICHSGEKLTCLHPNCPETRWKKFQEKTHHWNLGKKCSISNTLSFDRVFFAESMRCFAGRWSIFVQSSRSLVRHLPRTSVSVYIFGNLKIVIKIINVLCKVSICSHSTSQTDQTTCTNADVFCNSFLALSHNSTLPSITETWESATSETIGWDKWQCKFKCDPGMRYFEVSTSDCVLC